MMGLPFSHHLIYSSAQLGVYRTYGAKWRIQSQCHYPWDEKGWDALLLLVKFYLDEWIFLLCDDGYMYESEYKIIIIAVGDEAFWCKLYATSFSAVIQCVRR